MSGSYEILSDLPESVRFHCKLCLAASDSGGGKREEEGRDRDGRGGGGGGGRGGGGGGGGGGEVVVKEEGGGEEKAEKERGGGENSVGRESAQVLSVYTHWTSWWNCQIQPVPSSRTSLGESSLPIN